ncbi:MAG TPA: YbhB/YbcL family Raf kinase inhibitor-like protein [Pyrinomonadaceae bacterium]|nr:YbhB/YbcL family Raf kinase inhibitor-like protein [Pyrinomonadaceae bacterium]
MRLKLYTALLSSTFLLSACRGGTTQPPANANAAATPAATAKEEHGMTLKLTSTAFNEGGAIPARHTCDGENVSPPLAWEGVPEGTKTLALVADDPDAPRGTWVHWVVYRIPANVRALPENLPARETLDDGTRQGTNDFQKPGYGGPCPPNGTHRYYFKLYALDTDPDLPPAATRDQLLKALDTHILAQGELMGRYTRSK